MALPRRAARLLSTGSQPEKGSSTSLLMANGSSLYPEAGSRAIIPQLANRWRKSPPQVRKMSMLPLPPHETPRKTGRLLAVLPALVISMRSPVLFNAMPGFWQSSKRWIMANRCGKLGISTFRWLPGISIITPAGRNCWSRSFQTLSRWALSARSFPGIFLS